MFYFSVVANSVPSMCDEVGRKKKPKVSKVTLIVVMVYARGAVSLPTDSERHPSGGLEGKASENF